MDSEALDNAPDWSRFLRFWLGLSFVLHLLAAFFSFGFYQEDEHFQILEFMGAHLGHSPYSELAWEFQRQMRSWAQPVLYEIPVRALIALGDRDPFHWATTSRFVSALIGWLSLAALAACIPFWLKQPRWRKWAIRLTCLFWFTPYLHARTSGENLSGSVFLLAICAMSWNKLRTKSRPGADTLASPLTGALLGLSFLFRYQIGFAIAGFALWLWIDQRKTSRNSRPIWIAMPMAFLAMVTLGLALDAHIYGQWAFTPWNYFKQNVVLGAAAAVGRSPWYDYFATIAGQVPPLGALLIAGVFAGWIARPKNVLSLTSAAFVAGHCLVAHKELRFLFPVAAQLPVIATFALERWVGNRPIPRIASGVAGILIGLNSLVLLVIVLKPTSAQLGFYKAVLDRQPAVRELYHADLDPYSPFKTPIWFYKPAGLVEHEYKNIAELKSAMTPDRDLWLFHDGFEFGEFEVELSRLCELEYTAYPAILNHLTFLAGPRRFANRWSLFRCRL